MILNNITLKYLKLNKKRTIVTIIGIILSTALMVGIGLLISSVREQAIQEIANYSGNYNMSINNVSNNLNINHAKTIYYTNEIGFSKINSSNEYKPYLCIYNVSNNFFDELKLVEGRFPTNSDELVISDHISSNGNVNYKVGDTITLEYGNRYDESLNISNMDNTMEYIEGEDINVVGSHTYTIVGISKRTPYEDYSAPGYSVFTVNSPSINNKAYIIFDNPKNTYKYAKEIANNLNKKETDSDRYEDIEFNDDILYVYGGSRYGNFNDTMVGIMSVILSIIGIGCIMVIYNSFAISVMERKKEFGILSSVGTTKKQIMLSVLYEALIVGSIGIILGLIASFLGIGILIKTINYILRDMLETPLKLSFYPLYVLVPLIFMSIVVLISAFIPAIKASKITPIVAIRGNDDIKLNSKKLKDNKLITKLFGEESSIAYKNMKRNKKKYKTTVISLVVSFVLFVTFSSFSSLVTKSTELLVGNIEYDIEYEYTGSDTKGIDAINSLAKLPDIDEYRLVTGNVMMYLSFDGLDLTDEYKDNKTSDYQVLNMVKLSNEDYSKLLKKYNLDDNTIIFINKFKTTKNNNNNIKIVSGKILKSVKPLKLCYNKNYENETYDCSLDSINDYYLLDNVFAVDNLSGISIIVNEDTFNKYNSIVNKNVDYTYSYQLYIKTSSGDNISKAYNDLKKSSEFAGSLYEYNIAKQLKEIRNILLVIKILVYGFIILVTLIGVTSVLNTISTSIALRRREFAMLRSVGLTPKGLNKMIRFESLFFGLKTLLYGIPISFGLMYLFQYIISKTVSFSDILIPWSNLVIAIIGIFIIVFIAMRYSTIEIKKDNILEAIRDENI